MRAFFLAIIAIIAAIGLYTLFELGDLAEFKRVQQASLPPPDATLSITTLPEGDVQTAAVEVAEPPVAEIKTAPEIDPILQKIVDMAHEMGAKVHDSRVFPSMEACMSARNKVLTAYIKRGVPQKDIVTKPMQVLFKSEQAVGISTPNTYYYLTCIPHERRDDWAAYLQLSLYDD